MLKLHHVNICSSNLPELADFYKRALGLQELTTFNAGRDMTTFNKGVVALDAGDAENLHLHLAEADHTIGFRSNQVVNPVTKGHYAFRTDDIEQVKRRLDEQQIPYSDYGPWAVRGWYQIFFYDPTGTVVEVHQVL